MHLKSKPSYTGVARKLRLREYSCPSPSSNNLAMDLVETCGVWGEAPAADDFGAFFVLKKVFCAMKICM